MLNNGCSLEELQEDVERTATTSTHEVCGSGAASSRSLVAGSRGLSDTSRSVHCLRSHLYCSASTRRLQPCHALQRSTYTMSAGKCCLSQVHDRFSQEIRLTSTHLSNTIMHLSFTVLALAAAAGAAVVPRQAPASSASPLGGARSSTSTAAESYLTTITELPFPSSVPGDTAYTPPPPKTSPANSTISAAAVRGNATTTALNATITSSISIPANATAQMVLTTANFTMVLSNATTLVTRTFLASITMSATNATATPLPNNLANGNSTAANTTASAGATGTRGGTASPAKQTGTANNIPKRHLHPIPRPTPTSSQNIKPVPTRRHRDGAFPSFPSYTRPEQDGSHSKHLRESDYWVHRRGWQ